MAEAKRDQNFVTTLLGVTDDASLTPTNLVVDPTTKRLKVSAVITAGGGIQSINALTATAQLLTVGTAGTDFAIVSSVDTHTFNLPDASATARGVVTTDTQTFAGTKTFSSTISGSINGNAATATTATNATNTAITDDTTTNATMYPTWVTTASGNQAQKVSSTKLSFNPSTGLLTATGFAGPLTGNVTGNVSGNAGTVTTNANLTGPITSVGNATALAAQTGTGSVFVVQNTPTLTTPVIGVATGTSLALSAATSLTIGTASSLAGSIVFQNASNANTLTLKSGVTSPSYTITLPTAVGAAGTYLRDVAGDGVLSWAAVAGFSYGASVSGTTADGLTITLSNSSDDAAGALKLIAGNTQASQPLLANLQLGTSANVMGMLIQGTGGTTAGAAGTGLNHLTLWANTATSLAKVLAVGSEVSYTETLAITANGTIVQTSQASPAASTVFHTITANNTNANNTALMSLQIGSSAKVQGLIIQGTGSSTLGAVGTGIIHATLWANINSSTVKVLSIGSETSYTEKAFFKADGSASLAGGVTTFAAAGGVSVVNGNTDTCTIASNGKITVQGRSNNDYISLVGSSTTGTGNFARYLTFSAAAANNGWKGIAAVFTDATVTSSGGSGSYFIDAEVTQVMTTATNDQPFVTLALNPQVNSADTVSNTANVVNISRAA